MDGSVRNKNKIIDNILQLNSINKHIHHYNYLTDKSL
jgi:hypothetical protein